MTSAGGNPAPARILVVDDELDTAQSLAMLFRGMGKQVEYAINGAAALLIARRLRPEIVFVDIGLPDMDGWTLARRLRDEAGGVLRVVSITGRGDAESRRKSAEAGCEDHLLKPVDPAYIERLVTRES